MFKLPQLGEILFYTALIYFVSMHFQMVGYETCKCNSVHKKYVYFSRIFFHYIVFLFVRPDVNNEQNVFEGVIYH